MRSRCIRQGPVRPDRVFPAARREAPGHSQLSWTRGLVFPDNPVTRAFEEIYRRFDLFSSRIRNRNSEQHRRVAVMGTSHRDESHQRLARECWQEGTRWGNPGNLAEVPLFIDSAASRLIRISDLLALAVRERNKHGDTRSLDRVVHRFDAGGDVIQGAGSLQAAGLRSPGARHHRRNRCRMYRGCCCRPGQIRPTVCLGTSVSRWT